ncbi:MAG: RNA-binding domain-containing protein [Candidatus Bathyarchaeales archaeon]
MDKVKVLVEVEVNPTEDEGKVRRAVENIFGNLTFQSKPLRKGNILIGEASGLEALTKLYNLLRRERIRDAARNIFLEGANEKTVNFCLNKQAAFAGHISFSKEVAESPLEPIKVKIECDNPRELIEWLVSK